MAFSNVSTTSLDLSGGGTKSVSHDPGGAIDYCVVLLGGGDADFTAVATFGGVAIPERVSARHNYFTWGHSRVRAYVYTRDDGTALPSSASTFEVVVAGTPADAKAVIITGKSGSLSTLLDTASKAEKNVDGRMTASDATHPGRAYCLIAGSGYGGWSSDDDLPPTVIDTYTHTDTSGSSGVIAGETSEAVGDHLVGDVDAHTSVAGVAVLVGAMPRDPRIQAVVVG